MADAKTEIVNAALNLAAKRRARDEANSAARQAQADENDAARQLHQMLMESPAEYRWSTHFHQKAYSGTEMLERLVSFADGVSAAFQPEADEDEA